VEPGVADDEPLGALGAVVPGAAVAPLGELGVMPGHDEAPGAADVGLAAADVAALEALPAVEAGVDAFGVDGLVVALGPTQAVAITAVVTSRAAARRPSLWTGSNKVFLSGLVYQVTRLTRQTRHGRKTCQTPNVTNRTEGRQEEKAEPCWARPSWRLTRRAQTSLNSPSTASSASAELSPVPSSGLAPLPPSGPAPSLGPPAELDWYAAVPTR